MNVNEDDFQKKIDEIGKLYEDGKDAMYAIIDWNINGDQNATKALDSLRGLRDIAALLAKSAYELKSN